MNLVEGNKLADLRNKMGSVYAHFQMIEEMEKLKKEDPKKFASVKNDMKAIMADNEIVARKNIHIVKKILDSFG